MVAGVPLLDQTKKLRDWLALSPERMKRLGLYPEIILYLSPAKFEQLFRITALSDQDFEKFCVRLSEIRRLPYDKYSEEFNRLLGFFRIPVVMDVGELKEQIKKGKLPSNVARQLR